MSRKDFEATAAILKEMPMVMRKKVAEEFADHFETQNPRFDRDRFLFACGVMK